LTIRQLLPIIVKNEGFSALYRGFWVNCLRDVPGWGIYFYLYEYTKAISKRLRD